MPHMLDVFCMFVPQANLYIRGWNHMSGNLVDWHVSMNAPASHCGHHVLA